MDSHLQFGSDVEIDGYTHTNNPRGMIRFITYIIEVFLSIEWQIHPRGPKSLGRIRKRSSLGLLLQLEVGVRVRVT